MIAETDALRLVPGLRDQLAKSWTDFLDANPDDLTSPSDLPDHALVTCDQMIGIVEDAFLALAAAAPAVQPAAGRLADAIERVDRWANYAYTFEDTVAVNSPLSTFTAGDLRLILSALAHPPAQGSESGGEDWLALVMCNVDRTEGSGLQPVRSLDELNANTATYWRNEARSAIQGRSHLSALSPQPGPASEGDGE